MLQAQMHQAQMREKLLLDRQQKMLLRGHLQDVRRLRKMPRRRQKWTLPIVGLLLRKMDQHQELEISQAV